MTKEEFQLKLDELIDDFHGGTYESGFAIANLLREKASEIEDQIGDDMSRPC